MRLPSLSTKLLCRNQDDKFIGYLKVKIPCQGTEDKFMFKCLCTVTTSSRTIQNHLHRSFPLQTAINMLLSLIFERKEQLTILNTNRVTSNAMSNIKSVFEISNICVLLSLTHNLELVPTGSARSLFIHFQLSFNLAFMCLTKQQAPHFSLSVCSVKLLEGQMCRQYIQHATEAYRMMDQSELARSNSVAVSFQASIVSLHFPMAKVGITI